MGLIPDIDKTTDRHRIMQLKPFCHVCMLAKPRRVSYRGLVGSRTTIPLHTLHTDTKGPFNFNGYWNGISGYRHLLFIVDDCTSFKWTFPLKSLSGLEITSHFITLESSFKRQYPQYQSMCLIRSDGHKSYTQGIFKEFCVSKGIKPEFSNVESQEENGASERFNQTLGNGMRSLLFSAREHESLWPEAAEYLTDVENASYNSRLGVSSIESLTGVKPSYGNFNVFGSECYAFIPKKRRLDNTFGDRSVKCKFLNYARRYKGYKLLNLNSRMIFYSRKVTFNPDDVETFLEQSFGLQESSIRRESLVRLHSTVDNLISDKDDQEMFSDGAEMSELS